LTAQGSPRARSAKPATGRQRGGQPGGNEVVGARLHTGRIIASQRDVPDSLAARAAALTADWGPTAARVLLGLVLAWFGYHELVQPTLWTGYVPLIRPQSALAIVLVLAHGWLLLVLAAALVAGILARIAAAVVAILLLEIVISLTVTAGLSDLTLRDVGVLGLAIALTGPSEQRLTLTR
jgi:uncharacterized membrane protein YphA (DoxX/SURF4 family)